jgi:hypothetical protein
MEVVVICKQSLVAISSYITPAISYLVLNSATDQFPRLVALDSLNIDNHLLDCLLKQELVVRLEHLGCLLVQFGVLHFFDGHWLIPFLPYVVC